MFSAYLENKSTKKLFKKLGTYSNLLVSMIKYN